MTEKARNAEDRRKKRWGKMRQTSEYKQSRKTLERRGRRSEGIRRESGSEKRRGWTLEKRRRGSFEKNAEKCREVW